MDPSFKFVAAANAGSHLMTAYLLKDSSLSLLVPMALLAGTLFNCALANALHEVSQSFKDAMRQNVCL